MRLVYTILLPDELANRVRRAKFAVAERYGVEPWDLLTQPHITLKVSFEAESVEPYSEYLHRLARETEPFEIVVGRPALFEDPPVLFYDVVQDERLHALQRRILSDLDLEPREHEVTGFYFHVTVSETIAERDGPAARDALDDGVEFRFPLETLALWREVEGAASWVVFEVARVG